MHMNSVPQHLLSEDRREFERLLDEALRSAPEHPELSGIGQRLNPEQLRTMALSATALITAAAAAEYQHYVEAREELRHPAPAAETAVAETAPAEGESGSLGLAAALGETAEAAGAGASAMVAVLAPLLAGTAAVLFLLVGYILRTVAPGRQFGRTMVTVGWVFGAVTAAAILAAGVALLLTALRNSSSGEAAAQAEAREAVARAREEWRDALLARGILPFLRDALAQPGVPAAQPLPDPGPSRMPRLGYGRPGFSSPDDGSAAGRPRFSSPDYSSPDFGGPEHQPD
ncbi:hypothetical protein GT028_01775 [Streptomyces sp. SID2999]|uniref:hypothetical protein n=1 Tax=Streptomyces sp. SID2999 TaxID=2690258 RepID=UPI00136E4F27|nr:hypothetical protein [Streptomyces sp. SID2999]MYZ06107.1 hypothetical protein [Streptomyces sp. SID2999]